METLGLFPHLPVHIAVLETPGQPALRSGDPLQLALLHLDQVRGADARFPGRDAVKDTQERWGGRRVDPRPPAAIDVLHEQEVLVGILLLLANEVDLWVIGSLEVPCQRREERGWGAFVGDGV